MAEVRFAFADPQPDGVDVPAGTIVRCALLVAEDSAGVLRSTEPFPVEIIDGRGVAVLGAGVWHVQVHDVAGVGERWVQVPPGDASILYTELPDVDPTTVPVTPETLPVWQYLQAQIAAIDHGGTEAGSAAVQEWAWHFPGTLQVRSGLALRSFPPVFNAAGELQKLEVVGVVALLGTVGSSAPTGRVRFRLRVDGATYYESSIANGLDRSSTITAPPVEPLMWGQHMVVDITEIPAGGALQPGDLTVQVFWRWVSAG